MTLLLDTHSLIWFFSGNPNLIQFGIKANLI
jgi:PIN domain nuclease of toxin-antitoxin system